MFWVSLTLWLVSKLRFNYITCSIVQSFIRLFVCLLACLFVSFNLSFVNCCITLHFAFYHFIYSLSFRNVHNKATKRNWEQQNRPTKSIEIKSITIFKSHKQSKSKSLNQSNRILQGLFSLQISFCSLFL